MQRLQNGGDLYDLLGIPRSADPGTIRRAYRELARALRADMSEPQSRDRIRDLGHAYAVLSNPHSRELYDRLILDDGKPPDELAETADEQLIGWVLSNRMNGSSRGKTKLRAISARVGWRPWDS